MVLGNVHGPNVVGTTKRKAQLLWAQLRKKLIGKSSSPLNSATFCILLFFHFYVYKKNLSMAFYFFIVLM